VLLATGPVDGRSRDEFLGKMRNVVQWMAQGGGGRREESAACATGQALLQLDSSASHHACCNTHPTGRRAIGARLIADLLSGSAEVVDAHNVLSVRHWDRIGRGLLYAAKSSVPWAILHARTDTRNEIAEMRLLRDMRKSRMKSMRVQNAEKRKRACDDWSRCFGGER